MSDHEELPQQSPAARALAEECIRLLTPERLELIFRHALSTYPRECCGMLLVSGIVRCCENAQDKLHDLDPREFPRTSTNSYCFDAEDQLFLARSFEGDDPVRIVYHSHPDSEPDFSDTDRRGAIVEGQPIYPGLTYLIVRSGEDRIGPARLFGFSSDGFQIVHRFH
jgi:proteasome lid subunit RPN8/RPN11